MGIWHNLQTSAENTDRRAGHPYTKQKMLKVLFSKSL